MAKKQRRSKPAKPPEKPKDGTFRPWVKFVKEQEPKVQTVNIVVKKEPQKTGKYSVVVKQEQAPEVKAVQITQYSGDSNEPPPQNPKQHSVLDFLEPGDN